MHYKKMIVLKPGTSETSQSQQDIPRPNSGKTRCSSGTNRIERTGPTIKRKSNKDQDISNQLKDININSSSYIEKHTKKRAPLELTAEFLSAVMKGDYKKAQILCQKILDIEPENDTCKEFQNVLNQVIHQEREEEEDEDGLESDSNSGCSEDGSDATCSIHSDDSSSSNEVEACSDDESEEEFTAEDLKDLNLYVGGVSVKKQVSR